MYIVNLYSPYIGQEQANIKKRLMWEDNIVSLLKSLRPNHIVVGGDLNVAPQSIDRYKVSKKQPGCSIEESSKFYDLLQRMKLEDCYRSLYPNDPGYTWGLNESKLRLDYFLTSNNIRYIDCYPVYDLHQETNPSDHYPIILIIEEPKKEQ